MQLARPRYVLSVALCIGAIVSVPVYAASPANAATSLAQPQAATLTPFTQQQVEALLPATVYFRGKTATLQTRNAGGVNFGGNAIVLASIVDTSGYASNIQDVYQMYLLTETPLTIGGHRLPAGAYGAGVVNGNFTVLDIGNHPVLQAPATQDTAMNRPRPLQVLPDGASAIKLYLGRNWIRIEEAAK